MTPKQHWCFGIDDFRVPAKSNNLEIKFNPSLWRQISSIVSQFRKAMPWKKTRGGNPYWIGPTDEVKAAQESIAWRAKEFIRRDIPGEVEVRIEAHGQFDCDNVLKIILDGLQDSGRLKNDRQVRIIHVERHYSRTKSGFTAEIIEL